MTNPNPDNELLTLSTALYDNALSMDEKMRVLSTLAHRGDEPAYKLLKAYAANPDPELAVIADIALGECGLFLAAGSDDDNDDDLVFTGIGPDGNMLRFFYMVLPVENAFDDSEKELIEATFLQRAMDLQCLIEKVEHWEKYSACAVLMPLTVSIAEFIQPVIDRCNEQNVTVDPGYYCGGWVPDDKEIEEILAVMHGEKAPDEPLQPFDKK